MPGVRRARLRFTKINQKLKSSSSHLLCQLALWAESDPQGGLAAFDQAEVEKRTKQGEAGSKTTPLALDAS